MFSWFLIQRKETDNYLFEEKDPLEESNSVPESQSATSPVVPQTTTESPLKRRKPATETKQDLQSSNTSSTIRPKTTRRPEFVHMPTVKFDFGSSSFVSKGSTRRTETGENRERIKESQKEKIKQSTWPSRNDITKKEDTRKSEKVRNKIGSSLALIKYGSKARFNDKDDSMFPQADRNRWTCQTISLSFSKICLQLFDNNQLNFLE